MSLEDLRTDIQRYINPESLNDHNEIFEMYLDFLFGLIKLQGNVAESKMMSEGRIILQMMFTRLSHLKSALRGIEFVSRNGEHLNGIIDPTIIASAARNIYESAAIFNLVYVSGKSEDSKLISYNLWAHSGLSYRQRLENKESRMKVLERLEEMGAGPSPLKQVMESVFKANEAKHEAEAKRMASLVSEIKETQLYKSLEIKEQEKIDFLLKKREYKAVIKHHKVVLLSWQELSDVMGIKDGIFNNLYSYFSLYTHPSNVSVFQFNQIFQDGTSFLDLVSFNLTLVNKVVSIFIADYLSVYHDSMAAYEELPLREKILLDVNNIFFRGEDRAISDSWKVLG